MSWHGAFRYLLNRLQSGIAFLARSVMNRLAGRCDANFWQ